MPLLLNVIILMNSMSIQSFTDLFEMIIIFNGSHGMKKKTLAYIRNVEQSCPMI